MSRSASSSALRDGVEPIPRDSRWLRELTQMRHHVFSFLTRMARASHASHLTFPKRRRLRHPGRRVRRAYHWIRRCNMTQPDTEHTSVKECKNAWQGRMVAEVALPPRTATSAKACPPCCQAHVDRLFSLVISLSTVHASAPSRHATADGASHSTA